MNPWLAAEAAGRGASRLFQPRLHVIMDPQTPYEEALERTGLECAMAGCWKPIAAFVPVAMGDGCGRGAIDELGVCADHLQARLNEGLVPWVRWLET